MQTCPGTQIVTVEVCTMTLETCTSKKHTKGYSTHASRLEGG